MAPRDTCQDLKGERSPFIPFEMRPDSPGESGMQPRPNGRGGWTPLRPLRGLQETRVATREESGVLRFPSRQGLTPRVHQESNMRKLVLREVNQSSFSCAASCHSKGDDHRFISFQNLRCGPYASPQGAGPPSTTGILFSPPPFLLHRRLCQKTSSETLTGATLGADCPVRNGLGSENGLPAAG